MQPVPGHRELPEQELQETEFGSQVLLSSAICAKLPCAPRCFITHKLEEEMKKCQILVGRFFSLLFSVLIIDPKPNSSSRRTYASYKPSKMY